MKQLSVNKQAITRCFILVCLGFFTLHLSGIPQIGDPISFGDTIEYQKNLYGTVGSKILQNQQKLNGIPVLDFAKNEKNPNIVDRFYIFLQFTNAIYIPLNFHDTFVLEETSKDFAKESLEYLMSALGYLEESLYLSTDNKDAKLAIRITKYIINPLSYVSEVLSTMGKERNKIAHRLRNEGITTVHLNSMKKTQKSPLSKNDFRCQKKSTISWVCKYGLPPKKALDSLFY